MYMALRSQFDLGRLFGLCGFKQKYGLPCPTCGMTTSVLAFAQGRFLDSFYIQPAGAIFCCILVITALMALITAVFGVYFRFLVRMAKRLKVRYVIFLLLIIIASGWAVTLARAIVEKQG